AVPPLRRQAAAWAGKGGGDPGRRSKGAGRARGSIVRRGECAARSRHGGDAAAAGTGGGGLHGEESGEREYQEDAGSGRGSGRGVPAV
ncbi:unnamed protein product, partial [Gulo gulo]